MTRREHLIPHPSATELPAWLTVTVISTAFVVGGAIGALTYVHRSSVVEKHVAGTNAISVHIVIAVAVVALVISTHIWRPRWGHRAWVAPFSKNALSRLSHTIRLQRGVTVTNVLRVLLALSLVLVLLYWPFRMGEQTIGGLDVNSSVNAWGGPTYLGALLAHWLDCIVAFYISALVLNGVLVNVSS
jgi:hypothetical protein